MNHEDINKEFRLLVTLVSDNVGCSYYVRIKFDYEFKSK